MRVARALQRKGHEEFAKPGHLVEIRFVRGQSLSLTASRLLALMILVAGGDAWKPVTHRMRKADIRRGHKGNERISDMLEELHGTLFAEDDISWRGRKATRRFSLIASSKEEAENTEPGKEAGWIEWEFTPDARRLIQESETYAVMNRTAVLGFRSAYALKLYEIGALRVKRRQTMWKGDVIAFRAALGISPDVYKDFAQLRRKVLTVCKNEIDELAHFTVEWEEIRQGRTVKELEITFRPKDTPAVIQHGTAPEVSQLPPLAAGRPTANKNTDWTKCEKDLTFPIGSLQFGIDQETFAKIARISGGGWDIDLIAEAFRDHLGERLSKLHGAKLKAAWKGFCESYHNRRGRP
ncbi:RepB family plasmid replication initiator protein [Acetobacter musti]|uniref:RepB family plasmid replication initiator protein n=1 Tax=Acetobacter musti TaxID=864732 RepID=A0ABX0JTP7_9PROT|nr:replication initiation protein [Acetobacter musti]NHN86866.1 RepB family plasmid replication initiator protein [Acetobacter musti]